MKNLSLISEFGGLTVTDFYAFDNDHDIKMIDVITVKTGTFKKLWKFQRNKKQLPKLKIRPEIQHNFTTPSNSDKCSFNSI